MIIVVAQQKNTTKPLHKELIRQFEQSGKIGLINLQVLMLQI